MCVNNNEKEICCCFSLATMVSRTRHKGRLHLHRLSRSVCMLLVKSAVKPAVYWLPSDITFSYATAWHLLKIRSLITTRRVLITFGCDVSRRCVACLPLHYLPWISSQFRHLCWISFYWLTIANVLSIQSVYMDYHLTYSVCQTVLKSVYGNVAHYGRVFSLKAIRQDDRTKGSCCVFAEQMPFWGNYVPHLS